jgi:hypothetical protein
MKPPLGRNRHPGRAGAHAAVLVDQARRRLSGQLAVPPNITLIPLPAKMPGTEPSGKRQAVHARQLAVKQVHRIFKSFDDIVDYCCHAWNNLIDQPLRIMSIGLRVTRSMRHDYRVLV